MKHYHNVMIRLFALIAVTLFVFAVATADVIKENSFQVTSNGVSVTLHWITDQEANVAHFEIQRRSGTDGAFISIGTVDPKGASLYEFVDNTALQKVTTLYQYRIVVTFTNGATPIITNAVSVTHTVSGVRRTWGSIKAMFR
jgi:hypothetical protein